MQNHSEIAEFLWHIADLIKDNYEEADYEDVILPFTLLRRLDCVLLSTRDRVREAAAKYKGVPPKTRDELLMKAAGQRFYNVSKYSLAELITKPADLKANFSAYLDGFSDNVKDILLNFSGGEEKGLGPIYETLERKKLLLVVTKAFSEADLSPETVDNHGMGTIFEYLIRKFKESKNEKAGQFYTPRDVIRLMVKLTFEPDRAKLAKGKLVGIYDPACGTGGMLTIAKEHLLAGVNPKLDVFLYGQEINEKTYAVAKADMLMKGEDPENLKRENTLSTDLLPGKQFDYMLSNPPFGSDWKNVREQVEAEHGRGAAGRYAPGLPDVGDGAMLFLLHKISKLPMTGGRIVCVLSGTPLCGGDPESGPSEIRRFIVENDLLEAVVALPGNLFYNTELSTYLVIISNRKSPERKGKVQLIDASSGNFVEPLRKALGDKRFEISESHANEILKIYLEYSENKSSKILDNESFIYRRVCVETPLRIKFQASEDCVRKALLSLASCFPKVKFKSDSVMSSDMPFVGQEVDDKSFMNLVESQGVRLTAPMRKHLRKEFGIKDSNFPPVLEGEERVADVSKREYDSIPLSMAFEEFLNREILPYQPDAWLNTDKIRVGCDIRFTEHFYRYSEIRMSSEVAEELKSIEDMIGNNMRSLFNGESHE